MTANWPQMRLAQLGTLRNGMNFNRHQEGSGTPVLKVKDFGDSTFVPTSGLDELDHTAISISEEQLLRPGDVVIIRSNGNIALVGRSLVFRGSTRPTTFSGFCIRFRPNTEMIDARFAAYFIRSPICRQRLSAYGSGTGIQNLSQEIIGNVPIDLPPLAGQRHIADILGTLDDKIELNRRTNETLEAMARALFKSWFVDFDPVREKAAGRKPAGLDAETARLFPSSFEDSPLGKVPKGWKVVALPDAIEVNPTRLLTKGVVAPYLEMSNMPTTSARAVDWEQREFGSGMRFINGDTLVARITPCLENGKTAYVDFLCEGEIGWGSTEYIVLCSKPPLPTTFSYFLARTDDFRSHVIKNMTGTSGRQRAPSECLDQYLVVLPDAKVAERFGEFANGCLAMMKKNDEEATTLAVARDALLPKLLTGEISAPPNGESKSRK